MLVSICARFLHFFAQLVDLPLLPLTAGVLFFTSVTKKSFTVLAIVQAAELGIRQLIANVQTHALRFCACQYRVISGTAQNVVFCHYFCLSNSTHLSGVHMLSLTVKMQLSQQPGALNEKHSLCCRWKAPSDVGMQLPLYSCQTLLKHYLQQSQYSSATVCCVKTKLSSIRKMFSPVDASVHCRSDCITHITLQSCASKYLTQMGYSFTAFMSLLPSVARENGHFSGHTQSVWHQSLPMIQQHMLFLFLQNHI